MPECPTTMEIALFAGVGAFIGGSAATVLLAIAAYLLGRKDRDDQSDMMVPRT